MSTTLKPRTDTVVLFQGDDDQKIRELAARAERLKKSEEMGLPRTLGELPEYEIAAREHDEFKREATERAVTVTVQALRRRQWRSLVDEHLPRKDAPVDERFGVNLKTFPDALVPISITEPAFDTPADRDDFLDSLSDQQFEDVFWAAFGVNRRGGADPQDFLVARTSSTGTEN